MAEIAQLRIDQRMRVRVASIKDDAGNDAAVQGGFTWAVAPDGIGTLTPDADGMGVLFEPAGTVTAAGSLTGRADADLGAGVLDLVATAAFVVTSGRATVVGLEITVEDTPTPPQAA